MKFDMVKRDYEEIRSKLQADHDGARLRLKTLKVVYPVIAGWHNKKVTTRICGQVAEALNAANIGTSSVYLAEDSCYLRILGAWYSKERLDLQIYLGQGKRPIINMDEEKANDTIARQAEYADGLARALEHCGHTTEQWNVLVDSVGAWRSDADSICPYLSNYY